MGRVNNETNLWQQTIWTYQLIDGLKVDCLFCIGSYCITVQFSASAHLRLNFTPAKITCYTITAPLAMLASLNLKTIVYVSNSVACIKLSV